MRRVLSILLIILSIPSSAQDIHLSQFYANQQNLNPAMMGNYEGRYRAVANHRNQWRQVGGSAVTTSMIGYDQKFYLNSDAISGGILVLRDQFQDFSLNTDKILLSAAYGKEYLGNELRVGLQFGYTMKRTDLSNQTFPNQWVYQSGNFDRSLSNQESGFNESQNFFDINLGASWSKNYRGIKPTAGLAVFHVNTPTDSYFEDSKAQLASRYVLHASAEIIMNSSLTVEPQLLYMRATTAQDLLIGGRAIKELANELPLQFVFGGLLFRDGFSRNSDAIIPLIGGSYKDVEIGLSYDVNVSDLSLNSDRKGTFEISLIYTAPAFLPKKMTLPCDRY